MKVVRDRGEKRVPRKCRGKKSTDSGDVRLRPWQWGAYAATTVADDMPATPPPLFAAALVLFL